METPIDKLQKNNYLEALQTYMLAVTKQRGFDQQSPRDTLLVMLEEVGELAKALRKLSGIPVDQNRIAEYGNLKHEMADVFICLLILANKCNIDLFEAFCEKETINSKRTWK